MFYVIQWTWGIIMNIIGFGAYMVAKACKWQTRPYRKGIEIICPINFGGVSFGMFFVRGEKNAKSAPHEYGHSIQNLIFGPLFPFVIAIPSAIRYWHRTLHPEKVTTPYDSIWFEGQATKLGKLVVEKNWSWL